MFKKPGGLAEGRSEFAVLLYGDCFAVISVSCLLALECACLSGVGSVRGG